uniref:Uncharacterized protein n=1 Tax=Strongyloides papillosus TaxID=174720 RepID=A0A0N5B9D2_STREA
MGNLAAVPPDTRNIFKARYIEVAKPKTYESTQESEDDINGRKKFDSLIRKFLRDIKLFRCKLIGQYDSKLYYKEMTFILRRRNHVNLKIVLTMGKYPKFEDEVNDWIKKIKRLSIQLDVQLDKHMTDECCRCAPPCRDDVMESVRILLMCIQFPISNALRKLKAENGVVKFLREKYGITQCRVVPRRMAMFDRQGNRLGKKQFKLKDD